MGIWDLPRHPLDFPSNKKPEREESSCGSGVLPLGPQDEQNKNHQAVFYSPVDLEETLKDLP